MLFQYGSFALCTKTFSVRNYAQPRATIINDSIIQFISVSIGLVISRSKAEEIMYRQAQDGANRRMSRASSCHTIMDLKHIYIRCLSKNYLPTNLGRCFIQRYMQGQVTLGHTRRTGASVYVKSEKADCRSSGMKHAQFATLLWQS